MSMPIYTRYLQYRVIYGDAVATKWLHLIVDIWYNEDITLLRKYDGFARNLIHFSHGQ